MPSRDLNLLTQDTRDAADLLLDWAKRQGIKLLVTHTLRTCAEQDELYARGRTKPGPRVTGVRGCRSWHTHGRAIDILVQENDGSIVHNGLDPRYGILGKKAKELGFRWGGDFGDYGHFEYHPGLSIRQLCPDPSDCSHMGQPRSTKRTGAKKCGISLPSLAIACGFTVGVWVVWRGSSSRIP